MIKLVPSVILLIWMNAFYLPAVAEEPGNPLDAAQFELEEYLETSPNDVATLKSLGDLLILKARIDIWNATPKSDSLKSARIDIQKAQKCYQQLLNLHLKQLEAFPKFIDPGDREEFMARRRADERYMQAQLVHALALYWEAQTYDAQEQLRREALDRAATEFESIHQKYRSMVAGLYARIWQGKCYEEQDEIRIALGIYEELLEHEGSSPTIRNLHNNALRFRLICLNHKQREDYQLVIQEGEGWLSESEAAAETTTGLGIQWEVCRAHEKLGLDPSRPADVRKTHLIQAVNQARRISQFDGEFYASSSAMIERVSEALIDEYRTPPPVAMPQRMRQEPSD